MDQFLRWFRTTAPAARWRYKSTWEEIDPMTNADLHIRRETAVSMAINTVLSGVFFLVAFGFVNPVPVWGVGHFVFDFWVQAFAVAFMGTLVPCALSRRALRSGRVASRPSSIRLPANLFLRSVVLALPAAVLSLAIGAVLFRALGVAHIEWNIALAIKLAFGAGLALVITSLALRATLAEA
jgi:hypothetical protein